MTNKLFAGALAAVLAVALAEGCSSGPPTRWTADRVCDGDVAVYTYRFVNPDREDHSIAMVLDYAGARRSENTYELHTEFVVAAGETHTFEYRLVNDVDAPGRVTMVIRNDTTGTGQRHPLRRC